MKLNDNVIEFFKFSAPKINKFLISIVINIEYVGQHYVNIPLQIAKVLVNNFKLQLT